jgi:putative NADH-flavin reductase
MPQRIPSYLLALAVGELEFRPLGSRAGVYAEPPVVELAAWELADTPKMIDAMRGQDAVISALGRGLSFKSEHLIERSVPGILSAMKTAGVRRLIFMSAWGVGDTKQDAPLLPKVFFNTLLRGIYADKLAGDVMMRKSDLDWTIVLPTKLHDGPLTRNYRTGERLPMKGMASISRADTAHFMLDRINDRASIRKSLVVSY